MFLKFVAGVFVVHSNIATTFGIIINALINGLNFILKALGVQIYHRNSLSDYFTYMSCIPV